MNSKNIQRVCCWIGYGEGCRQPTILGKSYCETHYNRIYETFLPETAEYIIDKEIDKEIDANRTMVKFKEK